MVFSTALSQDPVVLVIQNQWFLNQARTLPKLALLLLRLQKVLGSPKGGGLYSAYSPEMVFWVAVKELKLSYHSSETLLYGICTFIHVSL